MRDHWRRQKELHLVFVYRERVLLNTRELTAEMDERRIHITMDGWDSVKTVVPNYTTCQPELAGQYKNFLKTKLTGVLVAGWKLILLRTFPWVKTGGNLAATALVHSLCKYQKDHPGEPLPPCCTFLLDGGPENVNKTFLGLCTWLVSMGVFQTVDIYRLPVGHTHNGLDQRFQAPSVWLHGSDAHEARTPEEWIKTVRDKPTNKDSATL